MSRPILSIFLALSFCLSLNCQSLPFVSHPDQLGDDAFAEWIAPKEDYGVFYFRKQFQLETVPGHFVVHVSADARYNLYVNGIQVSWGPAVGDLENWNYETVDLKPYLKVGENSIAAKVRNWGPLNGARQISYQTAFILQGDSEKEQFMNTNKSWKVFRDEGYFALPMNREIVGGGYIAGATDSLVAAQHPWEWKDVNFSDGLWAQAMELGKGNHLGLDTWRCTPWKLKKRELPPMEQKIERTLEVLETKGVSSAGKGLDGQPAFTVPPNTHAEIVFDNRVLTMGFPQLQVRGGEGSKIRIQYQESLFNSDGEGQKGNRNASEGKIMKGYYDMFIADGKEHLFEPLWIRVFRYVKLTVDTRSEGLEIRDFHNMFTAYPLEEKATFSSGDDMLKEIWDVSWRTARLCALETYMDCPYYEQLQYIGDTRIQALISMYVSGDDRLARNAIQQIYGSLQPMGLTKSNHPSGGIQIIPPFTLLYILMVHDYYMLRDDPEFIQQFIPGIKFMLEWFISRMDENGILGPLPYWNHIDGGTDFINGSPPGISEGGSAHISILLANTLDHAAALLSDFGNACDAERYKTISRKLKAKIMELCYSHERGLIAETPARQVFSQHTNIFAMLADLFETDKEKEVAETILRDSSLIQTTLYFKFYLFQALKKAGMGGEILPLMKEWESFLDMGFTTFPEHGVNSRSDCHAWSAHPMYDFLNITCGISPASPGFKTVDIQPQLGKLIEVEGSIIHPLGEISTWYKKLPEGGLQCEVILPENLTGEFGYLGNKVHLSAGSNVFLVE